jgi:hypothetical protein
MGCLVVRCMIVCFDLLVEGVTSKLDCKPGL